jgi:phosphoribosylglycinamide formyltransferase 1
MDDTARVAVLVSGRGTNLQSLLDAQDQGVFRCARIVLVASNRKDAYALERAARHGIETAVLSHRSYSSREAYDEALVALLRSRQIDWVCLAGFMRILSPVMVRAFPQRILNIHPALLPAFPGLHVQQAALDYGVRVSGCTVHLVDEGVDTGPILVQRAVPVLDSDDADALSARILEQEHLAYPEALRLVTEKKWTLVGRRVRFQE